MSRRAVAFLASLGLVSGCAVSDDSEDQLASEESDLRGGTVAGPGFYEAVVTVDVPLEGCTGTLITKTAVLTAAHCACPFGYPTCVSSGYAVFHQVRPNGSEVRENEEFSGDFFFRPGYSGGTSNDQAVLRLDDEVDDTFQVTPLGLEISHTVNVGDSLKILGRGSYGPWPSGADCQNSTDDQTRYQTTTAAFVGSILNLVTTSTVGPCHGDSGGPALWNEKVVASLSSGGPGSGYSQYIPIKTNLDWLDTVACPDYDASDPDAGFCAGGLCDCRSGEGDCDSTSECISGAKCVSETGLATGLPYYYDVCWNTTQLATVYANTSFGGASQDLPLGTWNASYLTKLSSAESPAGVGNDTISSIRLEPGLTAILHTENACFSSVPPGPYIATGSVASLPTGVSNNTSCVIVLPGVTVYDNSSFGGTSQTYTAGTYHAADMTALPNDRIDSLIATPGMLVQLCSENAGPGIGECRYYDGEVANVNFPPWDTVSTWPMRNNASYIRVQAGATMYRDRDYQGARHTFAPGIWIPANEGFGNDNISSLIVAPGMYATLCTEASGPGTGSDCKTFTGSVSHIGFKVTDYYEDQISWIQVGSL